MTIDDKIRDENSNMILVEKQHEKKKKNQHYCQVSGMNILHVKKYYLLMKPELWSKLNLLILVQKIFL